MPEKQDGNSLLSDSDKAIYQYLDEMLSDPGEGSGSAVPAPSPANGADEPPAKEKSRAASLTPVARAVSRETPQPAPKPLNETPTAEPRPLPFREKPQPRVLSSAETLLKFEKPIVVQQPAVEEKVVEKVATKTATSTPVETKTPVKTETKAPVKTETGTETATQAPATAKADTGQEPAVTSTPVIQEPDTANLDKVVDSKAGDELLPPMTPWCDNGRPQWAQERFECLLFEVAGLKLAVPLVTLGAVHQIDRKFRSLPGQYDWFIGILQTNLGNIKVIDTALCVMPERYDRANRKELEFVITLHGFSWGISCHKLLKSITLEPEDVKWRTQRGKRPWMAGTVVEQMCALVDPAGFHNVILEAENRKK